MSVFQTLSLVKFDALVVMGILTPLSFGGIVNTVVNLRLLTHNLVVDLYTIWFDMKILHFVKVILKLSEVGFVLILINQILILWIMMTEIIKN